MTVTVATIGIDHRHCLGMLRSMQKAGCRTKGWWTEGSPATLDWWIRHFPDLPRVEDRRTFLDDPEIDIVLIAAIPADRAALAIEAMEAGKDVMVDKPGCTSLEQLAQIKQVQARTGRIWSVDFSERFEVRAVTRAAELVQAGEIGRVVQTAGFGPHRVNRAMRDPWFFDHRRYGGILADIGSHQIDQFLYFTGSDDAEVVSSTVGNYGNPGDPDFEDFGEMVLRSDKGHGYIRLDWYTPDGLPTWGDGRLTILGTEGYIELRKYVDIAGRPGTNHLFLVNGSRCEYIDCSDAPLPYFGNLVHDIENRTETAMPQRHAYKTTELALKAEAMATRVGNLKQL